MKKVLPILVLLGLLSVSCDKPDLSDGPQTGENGSYTFVLNARVDETLTRTNYADDDVTFSWSTDDEISVLFHKNEDHKFFTLRTSQGGSKSASFSGQVENGYELGASVAEGGVAWALFPANGSHSWNTTTHLPDFFQTPGVDFTETHFSANLPMYANADAQGNFSFKYLTGCYKFVFTDVPATKVRFSVRSAGSHDWYLSGKSPIKSDESTYYLQCNNGTGSRNVSIIEAVDPTEKKAVFYIPFRCGEPFTPEFTLTDEDNDNELLHATAKNALKPAAIGQVVVLPAKSLENVVEP